MSTVVFVFLLFGVPFIATLGVILYGLSPEEDDEDEIFSEDEDE